MAVKYEVVGKVFFVTGGASGIGARVVDEALKENAKHVAIIDINENAGKEYEKQLKQQYGDKKVSFIKCNVIDESDLNNAYDRVLKDQGYIDVVMNAAGIMDDGRNVYLKEIALNVTALITSTFKAIDIMRTDHGGKGGTIINCASIAAMVQIHILPVYFATKSAVLQFSNCIGMKEHYNRTNVRVITMCFEKTDTPLIHNVTAFDDETTKEVPAAVDSFPTQKVEAAGKSVIDAYKNGESGSTWLSAKNKPGRDISHRVKEAYDILTRTIDE